ncbi:EscU/YscU/HrcU family type III secretion system export apparatus switch protein [Aciduricibacillus chroicocephali]|uniref:EscU/YscU/HrcU family type III secretion system export apparatus switch protein n=1 Tax=Aciduricibacillus chroicocephali TaxID=3054939 RepID=A0ABY9KXY5_9BACI|nr:EscU/YscU/HrcU family type III secretion system export apparatus switch protein [Bacillaceae bacterium 44XB]
MNEQRKKAVALKYDTQQHTAPKVAATGKGLTAENIIQKAKESNVPIMEDASLVELLGKLDINQAIPEELYQAVAEVFAYIYKTDQDIGRKKHS